MNRIRGGDALLVLAVISLSFAALLPRYRARAFDRLVQDAVDDVEALRVGAFRARELNGRWPGAAPAGIAPQEVSGSFPGDSAFIRDGYALEWRLWRRVEETPAPPRPPVPLVLDDDELAPPPGARPRDTPPDSAVVEMMNVVHDGGAIVVHSEEPLVLAELLRRYGQDVSFVRDTTWTLLVRQGPAD